MLGVAVAASNTQKAMFQKLRQYWMKTPRRRGGLIGGLHWPTCRDKETVKFAVQKGLRDPLQRYVNEAGLDNIYGAIPRQNDQ